MALDVNELIKRGNKAAAAQQATIEAAQQTAKLVAANRPNPKPVPAAGPAGTAAPAGGAA